MNTNTKRILIGIVIVVLGYLSALFGISQDVVDYGKNILIQTVGELPATVSPTVEVPAE